MYSVFDVARLHSSICVGTDCLTEVWHDPLSSSWKSTKKSLHFIPPCCLIYATVLPAMIYIFLHWKFTIYTSFFIEPITFEADNLLGICIDFIQQKIREFVKLCRNKSFWNSKWNKFDGKSDFLSLVMFMYSEKAAKSYEISTLLLS